MHQYLEAVAKSGRCRFVGKVALVFLALPVGMARAQVPCNPTEVTATLDSTGSAITLDHTAIQCNGIPALLEVNAIDNAPFDDFFEVTYVSGPANILIGCALPVCAVTVGLSFPAMVGGVSVLNLPYFFNVSGVYTFQANEFHAGTAPPQTFTVTVTSCPGPPVTAITIATNEDCDPSINPKCSANIVLANGSETTEITTTVQPPQAITVNLSADFGSVDPMVMTDSSGSVISDYTAGSISFGSTSTTVAELSATACGKSFRNVDDIFNYNGFNFHESQVSDAAFVDSSAQSESQIQAFFVSHGSFLANFILVGEIGGFEDLNGNGVLDPGEPTYSVIAGTPIPPHARGVHAAEVFASNASEFHVNPKVLLATAQKEKSLIGRANLPGADILNAAMGCPVIGRNAALGFVRQVHSAASTFMDRFNDRTFMRRTISYPFFFHASDGILHNDGIDREPVGFQVQNAATYAQYRYTSFIQSEPNGGGVYLFETVWRQFGF